MGDAYSAAAYDRDRKEEYLLKKGWKKDDRGGGLVGWIDPNPEPLFLHEACIIQGERDDREFLKRAYEAGLHDPKDNA